MNIWMLTSEYPPDFGGGIGMYVNQAAVMMARGGHEVTVLVRDPHQNTITYEEPNLRIVRFQHMQGEFYNYLGYWTALSYQYAEEVSSLLKSDENKPDVIEVQDYNGIGYYLLMRKWQFDTEISQIPIILHLHTPTFELDKVNQAPRYKFPNYWIGHMEKFCMKAADALLSPSQFLADQIQNVAPENPIQVINLPYQLEEYDNEEYVRNHESDTLLYFGRAEYRKGVQQMISGAEKLWLKGHRFKLKIIGGDTYFHPRGMKLGEFLKNKYSRWINEGLLLFKDAIPPADLNPEILNAKAVIVPSLYENFPYTCLTSMWLGSPMLVSKSGGQAEMVGNDGAAGLIFDWNKEDDFENKLLQMINFTKEELKAMSIISHQRIRSLCNIEKNLKLRIEYFQQIIEKTKINTKISFPSLLDTSLKVKADSFPTNCIKGKLSIIIPYYNLGTHIEETMQSALKTEYDNFEIIIVNDGSNDPLSIDVLEKYRSKVPKIKVVDISNKGLANARNVGAINAEGEYIAFLDADDLIEPHFYPKAIKILDSYANVSFVYSWLEYFGNASNTWPTFNTEFPYLLASNMLSAFVVVRRQDFIEYGLNKDEMEYGMEDYEGWISMCAKGCLGVSIPEALVKYRVRTNSMSRQFNRDMIIYLRERMASINSPVYEKYGAELFKLVDANGPGYLWDNPTMTYPTVGYGNNNTDDFSDINAQKYELMRLANSKWGARLIKLAFKLKINKFFR
ncbi:glycosyl transferase family protein [Paenibacillus sp. FSL R7-269]|uniref:glycosyltransferase n=1 Tax=Paenibacillus sp. FSL R7-269 TaxID=1226755 RepID=UPI0003E23E47|nr:glycosyltransferase [Paenibacillus sp. FSL R7-269]ETT50047.1 glycosyl transferase family protein [Paenibacillus sp. FSL R7-269]